MITFEQHIAEICKAQKITDAEQITSVKRWYNEAYTRIKKKLNRRVNSETIFADLTTDIQSYQLPEYVGRVFNVRYNKSGSESRLIEVNSHDIWLDMNSHNSQHGVPTHYHMPSDDEIELFPIPNETITDGLEVSVSFKGSRLTANDVTVGTASVSNGSQTVTLTSSVVTTAWVGRWFTVDDGHEEWYRISEYISSTSFNIENYFAGTGGASLSYIVGDMVDIPDEYIDLPQLYTIAKYIGIYRKNRLLSKDMMKEFEDKIKEMRQDYASNGRSGVVKNRRTRARGWPVNTPWYFEDELS